MVADRPAVALIADSMEMIVAAHAHVRYTGELLDLTREALASSRELLYRTSSFRGSSSGS